MTTTIKMNNVTVPVVIAGLDANALAAAPEFPRDSIAQQSLRAYPLRPEDWRIHDDVRTLLGATPTSDDDLAIVSGTFATAVPTVQTADVKSVTKTRYARRTFILPDEYDDGQSVVLSFMAGMLQNAADTSASLDVEVFKFGDDSLISGVDLYSGAGKSINSLVFAEQQFSLDSSGLAAGDWLDVRITIATVDASGVSPVIGCLAHGAVLIDTRG